MFTTALFDLDGVLIDSKPAMKSAWKSACTECHLNVPFDEYMQHVGKPFENILCQLDIPQQFHQTMKQAYGKTAASMTSSAHIYKHTYRVLKKLRYSGIRIGIVTSKEYWRADEVVDTYLLNCDLLVTPEQTTRGKPYPDPIIYALNTMNAKASEAFYIGDMKSDQEAASGAKVYFIKANWGYGSFSYPGVCLDSPAELLDFLGCC